MQLQYNNTRWISTADLHIACDPPILFEVRTRLSPEWAQLHLDWEEAGGEDADVACEIVGRAFVHVAQGNEKYPLHNKEGAKVLRDAIEKGSPGEGDDFICHLALRFAQNHYRFLALNSAASGRLLPPLNGIADQSKSKTVKETP